MESTYTGYAKLLGRLLTRSDFVPLQFDISLRSSQNHSFRRGSADRYFEAQSNSTVVIDFGSSVYVASIRCSCVSFFLSLHLSWYSAQLRYPKSLHTRVTTLWRDVQALWRLMVNVPRLTESCSDHSTSFFMTRRAAIYGAPASVPSFMPVIWCNSAQSRPSGIGVMVVGFKRLSSSVQLITPASFCYVVLTPCFSHHPSSAIC